MQHLWLRLINIVLHSNQASRRQLALYCGKSICLEFVVNDKDKATQHNQQRSSYCCIWQIAKDGTFLLSPHHYSDATVTIVLAYTIKYFIDNNRVYYLQHTTINGDRQFAYKWLEIMSQIHFNGLYTILDHPLANLIYNMLSATGCNVFTSIKRLGRVYVKSLIDYLLYNAQCIVEPIEHATWCNDVDNLRAAVENIAQQVTILKEQLPKPC